MKTRWVLFVAMILLTGLSLSAQKPVDLVGTWGGDATLDSEAEANFLTLVLEMKDGELSGYMTGEYGTLNESSLNEIKLENDNFSFEVMAAGPGGGEVAIAFKLKVAGDTMEGSLEIPDMGASGKWEAIRKK
ncbi:MAG: hypothetical protein WBB73_09990 [Candidatus Aminicenantaceae bacterium]